MLSSHSEKAIKKYDPPDQNNPDWTVPGSDRPDFGAWADSTIEFNFLGVFVSDRADGRVLFLHPVLHSVRAQDSEEDMQIHGLMTVLFHNIPSY